MNNVLSPLGKYSSIGLLDTPLPDSLSLLIDKRFASSLKENTNIKGVFVTEELSNLVPKQIMTHISKDPVYDFYTFFNKFHKTSRIMKESIISPSAIIHDTAYIAEKNVNIGDNVKISPGAIILEDVTIKEGSFIGEGSIIGCSAGEVKQTSNGPLDVYHNLGVKIERNVFIGANCTIDKGIYDRKTIVGNGTRIGNNTLICHGTQIGMNCTILCCTICGSVTIENNVRINPGATVSNKIRIKDSAVVTVGAVVMSDVEASEKVSGNFAINHNRYLNKFIKTFGLINSKK